MNGDTFTIEHTTTAVNIVAVKRTAIAAERIVVIRHIATVVCERLGSGAERTNRRGDSHLLEIDFRLDRVPFASSKPGAEPRSFYVIPFCAYGYQNRACFCTHEWRTFDYRQ